MDENNNFNGVNDYENNGTEYKLEDAAKNADTDKEEPTVVITDGSGDTTALPDAGGPGASGPDNKKKTIIIAVCALAAVAIIIAAIFIIRGKTSGNKEKPGKEGNSGSEIGFDITNSDGEYIGDEELESQIKANYDPDVVSQIAEASTKFKTEDRTDSNNVIIADTDTTTSAAATTKAANSGNGNASNGGNGSSNGNSNSSNGNGGSSGGNSTPAPATTKQSAANNDQAKAAEAQIKAFFNRKCYFEGVMYQDGTGSPMAIAFNGDDYDVFTSLDGIEIAIMKVGGKIYMKRPGIKQYVELNDTLLSTLDLSLDDINMDLGGKNYNSQQLEGVDTVTINGKDGLRYRYKSATGHSEFYCLDGKIVEIQIKDNDFNLLSKLQVDVFSTSIPSDQLNLTGYTEAKSLFAMLSDIVN